MERYSIGLDLGTSAAKGVLFSETKGIVAKDTSKFIYKQSSLPDGSKYNGIDVECFYRTICSVLKSLSAKIPADAEFCGIAMASASGNTVLCDKDGNAIIDGYSWVNDRFVDEANAVYGEMEELDVRGACGWSPSYSFPYGQLPHLRVHAPEILDSADKVCMTTEYVLHRLTGKWGIDVSTATPTSYLDQKKRAWNKDYLKAVQIDESKFPPLMESGDLLGEITETASADTGCPAGTKVFVGSFDHPTAARACNITKVGELLISCGTSWVCFYPFDDRDTVVKNRHLCDPFLTPNGPWGAMCSLSRASETITELVEKYISDGDNKFDILDECSAKAERGAGGLSFNPLAEELPDLSGYSKENIARALMEGIALQLKNKLGGIVEIKKLSMCGGPSSSKMWQEVISYTFDAPITVTYGAHSGAVGAAMYALK